MNGNIHSLWNDAIGDLRKHLKTIIYDRRIDSIEATVFKKERIKVVFFVINLGMWKNDKLFRMFLDSGRFDPYIVTFPQRNDDPDTLRKTQEELRWHFEAKGFPFIEGYDFTKNEYFDLVGFAPDILFYVQPYGVGGEEFSVDKFMRHSLFAYIPYGIPLNDIPKLYNQLYKNICWRLFYPTEYSRSREKARLYTRRDNIAVCGFPFADYLAEASSTHDWKDPDARFKRIIWAPHHSVLKSDVLDYSTFLEIADGMLELAERYSSKVQFAFKPHPLLKEKLCRPEVWGRRRTEEYYARWAAMPNTSFTDGEYYDLFMTSDALIHDCCSFMTEYLYTGKPLMFITHNKEKIAGSVNDFGKECLKRHYFGSGIEDIETFIDSVVIGGNDTMLGNRKFFYEKALRTPGTGSVAENIFKEFSDALK